MVNRILEYESPRKPVKPPWKLVAFVVAAGCVGVIYWWSRDWWEYVEDMQGRRWKTFELPVWWQVFESALVGVAVAGLLAVGPRLRRWWKGRQRGK